MTVYADITGILSIQIQEGKTARVGDIVAVIVETNEPPATSTPPKTPDAKESEIPPKDYFQKAYDIKLGFLSFFVKASCLALKEFPEKSMAFHSWI